MSPAAGQAASRRRWTDAQLQAICLRGRNLLVSAAAGSGKTSVLVERILRRLLDPASPVEIDRLLVVTFTEAAAAEMKERIRNRLEQALAEHPGDARLRRQLALLGRASISTVHSFCLRITRQYFYRLGLDPATRVAGEHEAQLLRFEVLDEVFERRYAQAAPDFLALVEAYGGGRGDESLRKLVLDLYDSAYARPWPEAWLDGLARMYRDGASALEQSTWFAVARQGLVRAFQRHARRLAGLAAQCRQPGGPAVWAETLEDDARRLEALARELEGAGWEAAGRLVAQAAGDWPRLPRNPQSQDPMHARIQKGRNQVKDQVRDLAQGMWSRAPAEVAADLARLQSYVQTLVDLCRDFARSLQAAKRDRGLMDFADMEHYALQVLADPEAPAGILRPSPVARELRRFFQEVLVDEYQDINPLQDAILQLVAGDGEEVPFNLFMVGDVKQSIYAFRQAEPAIFLARYRAYPPAPGPGDAAGGGASGGGAAPARGPETAGGAAGVEPPGAGDPEAASGRGWRIDLNANFRSRPAVLAAVNDLFRRIMVPELGGLAYDEEARLNPGAPYPDLPPGASGGEAPVEVYLLERKPEALDEDWPDRLEGGAGFDPAGSLPPGTAGARTGGTGTRRADPEETPAEPPAGDEDDGLSVEEAADLTALEQEARLVAWRIRELVEGTGRQPPLLIWDPEQNAYRPVRYRDVVVLLRSARLRASTFVEVLDREGVPVYSRSRTGYLVAPEVEVMLALLQVLDNPRQDIALAAVLRSPVVGLGARDLARIRLAGPGLSFYEAACRVAGWDPEAEAPVGAAGQDLEGLSPSQDAGSAAHGRSAAGVDAGASTTVREAGGDGEAAQDPLAARLRRFLADLSRWRSAARRYPLSRVIQQLYDETGILAYVSGLPAGEQRRANLEALRDRARQFDQFARQGLFRFLRFIDRLRERGDDLGTAPALGENDDVVRVMTIHQSKGLEFPVVVVADLGVEFQFDRGHALIHRDLGLGLKVADPDLRIRYPSLAYEAVRTQQRLDTLAEELRILYVALTRARERLILVGSARDLPASAARWWAAAGGALAGGDRPLPAEAVEGATRYLDWLGPALIPHPDAAPLRQLAMAPSPLEPAAGSEGLAREGWTSRWRWTVWLRPPATPGAAAGPSAVPGPQDPESIHAERPADGQRDEPVAPAPPGTGQGTGGTPAPSWLEPLVRGQPLPAGAVDGPAVEALRRRLRWRYPYAPLANRFAKRSVSELKGQDDPEWQAYALPADLRRGLRQPRLHWNGTPPGAEPARPDEPATAAAVTGAARGTATHRVLQHLDLAGPMDRRSIERQIESLVARRLLAPAEAAAVDVAALARFFAGPLGRRLLHRPDRVYREWMFTLGVPAVEMYPDLVPALEAAAQETGVQEAGAEKAGRMPARSVPAGDLVVVQGIVDCFVDEEDGLLLLDFKTDEPRQRSIEQLAAFYAGQVRFYRRALAEITGRPVKEAYLCFLATGDAVPVG
ncbi:UvrD-helicase domain-containing protein [Thermaerobacter subterraneus]|uniref:ATP-dependent helicase/nuclease subunit A n=1 Tax=Thermaerobacter subterraneus DSM 13965 TaxID=867903 RepID=K6PZM0_9FIRM|nr:UvrD-helicase domain-containing protein [Thermaerobacter subterraneus]EKP94024.1 ATP-dependent exonuclase V beta subunit, helicase and exonuclease domain-containing [Thermaerobacter subterraneus DSM 13965]